MTLMLQLLIAGALAASPDPLATGQDLVAWRALQEQTDPVQWRRFLMDYPASPLAELAWRRLVEVGHAPDPTANPSLNRISTSYNQHEEDLARTPQGFAVATLRLDTPALAESDKRPVRRVGFGLRLPLVLTAAPTARITWSVVEDPVEY